MISAAASGSARLVQRLRAQAERIAASRAAANLSSRRRDRRAPEGTEWRSATALWPDFTADTDRS